MTWITPKTDWYGATDSNGNYTGDRFNAEDYNRIMNNLQCLYDLSILLYKSFDVYNLDSTKTAEDYLYANDINNIENNFAIINSYTLHQSYGEAPTYYVNGKTMDFTELNRLESAMLDLYNKLTIEFNGRRMLTWNFGMKGDF